MKPLENKYPQPLRTRTSCPRLHGYTSNSSRYCLDGQHQIITQQAKLKPFDNVPLTSQMQALNKVPLTPSHAERVMVYMDFMNSNMKQHGTTDPFLQICRSRLVPAVGEPWKLLDKRCEKSPFCSTSGRQWRLSQKSCDSTAALDFLLLLGSPLLLQEAPCSLGKVDLGPVLR